MTDDATTVAHAALQAADVLRTEVVAKRVEAAEQRIAAMVAKGYVPDEIPSTYNGWGLHLVPDFTVKVFWRKNKVNPVAITLDEKRLMVEHDHMVTSEARKALREEEETLKTAKALARRERIKQRLIGAGLGAGIMGNLVLSTYVVLR